MLPWHDSEAYIRLVLEWSIQSYLEHVPSTEPVFSDQGMPDTNAMTQKAQRSHTRPKKFCLRSVVR